MKKLELSETQHLLWDRMMDERALLDAREARALAAMLAELGGGLDAPWQFDRRNRTFWMNAPDEPVME